MTVTEIAAGLWGWTAPHPSWEPDQGWDRDVWCYYAELHEATVLVDPLVPEGAEERFWTNLDRDLERRGLPVWILLTAPHHRRSAAAVAARYDARIWDGEETLPAGVRTFSVEHPQPVERPLWLEAHRALAFGDALTTGPGELRVWWDLGWPEGESWYGEHLLPSLHPLLSLSVEHVLVGHGPPVIGEGAKELRAALERPPYAE